MPNCEYYKRRLIALERAIDMQERSAGGRYTDVPMLQQQLDHLYIEHKVISACLESCLASSHPQ